MAVELISPTGLPVKLNELLEYDPETGGLTWLPRPKSLFLKDADCLSFKINHEGKPAFTSFCFGYKTGGIFQRQYRAHRVIWAMVHGDWPDGVIDHINGNRADNRIANLRAVSGPENHKNQMRPSNNTSGRIGVNWNNHARKWAARVAHEGRRIHLGYFNTVEEAGAARKAAEAQYGFHINHGREAPLCEG